MKVRRLLGAAVTLVALLGAAAHLIWPGLKIDAITVLLLVVALVPWLGELLESIELPGGWKVKYRDLRERQDALERTTEEASSTAQAALGAARGEDLPPTMETVRRFAEEYRRLRKTSREPARTAELDRLFGTMVTVLPRVPGFDPVQALGDDEGGIRLAGYAALYGRPDPALLDETIRALSRETTAFIQYWAIRTVAAMLERADPADVPDEVFDILDELYSRLPRSSSRHEQLGRLLEARRYG
ncbi:hypothetical protein [Amycolatopsis kentuckyensis]|uniref:hypothetical protein n=1 Tax=Amycolatopsis kentuckyensis TaxID=218823 RepID=UPI000A37BD93|nr:hypothetical protein [Amycolatopsis kentuckyensis]